MSRARPRAGPRVLTVRRPLVRPGDRRHASCASVRGSLVRRVLALGARARRRSAWRTSGSGSRWSDVGYELSAARQMQLRLEHERRELEVELATLRDPAASARSRAGASA